MKGQIQEFRPRDLKRILRTLPKDPSIHPNRQDLEDMARDVIAGAGGFTASPKQAAAARRTIQDLKEKSACPPSKKKP